MKHDELSDYVPIDLEELENDCDTCMYSDVSIFQHPCEICENFSHYEFAIGMCSTCAFDSKGRTEEPCATCGQWKELGEIYE